MLEWQLQGPGEASDAGAASGGCSVLERLRGDTPLRQGAVAALCWSSHEEIAHVKVRETPVRQ